MLHIEQLVTAEFPSYRLSVLLFTRFTVGCCEERSSLLRRVSLFLWESEQCCADSSSLPTPRFTVGHTFRTSRELHFLPVYDGSGGYYPRIRSTQRSPVSLLDSRNRQLFPVCVILRLGLIIGTFRFIPAHFPNIHDSPCFSSFLPTPPIIRPKSVNNTQELAV